MGKSVILNSQAVKNALSCSFSGNNAHRHFGAEKSKKVPLTEKCEYQSHFCQEYELTL
jgi:hypothetical protein